MHVPMGGDLKLILMLLLAGERIMVAFDRLTNGGNWHCARVIKKRIKGRRFTMLDVALIVCRSYQRFHTTRLKGRIQPE